MAICRFSETSDVYVHESTSGGLDCCGCVLVKGTSMEVSGLNASAMIRHLQEHAEAGHKVPSKAFDEITLLVRELG